MKFFLIILTSSAFVFAGCFAEPLVTPGPASTQQTPAQETQRVKVVTSFYPLYEIAKQVGGEYVDVKNLVPPGAEPHDYELTPRDIVNLYEADILVVNGAGLEPWIDKLIPDLEKSNVRIIDESKIFKNLIAGFNDGQESETGSSYDPHIWLDPSQYSQEVMAFEQVLSSVDPAHKDYYASQSQRFKNELIVVDGEFMKGLQNCTFHEFVTNHAAFGYLAKRYNLEMVSITGISPDAEPSPKDLAALTDLLKQKGMKYILVETLVSPKIGETLANEVGAKILVLNPLEGLSDKDLAAGKNYVSVMYENLKNLQIAMDCR